jgi:hypothetical protein
MKKSTTFLTNTNGDLVPNWEYIENQLATLDYGGREKKREIIAELRADYENAVKFREAMIEQCILLYMDWNAEDPQETMRRIITAEVNIALDPRVSKRAAELAKLGDPRTRQENFV